jgi:hypothetical protein
MTWVPLTDSSPIWGRDARVAALKKLMPPIRPEAIPIIAGTASKTIKVGSSPQH